MDEVSTFEGKGVLIDTPRFTCGRAFHKTFSRTRNVYSHRPDVSRSQQHAQTSGALCERGEFDATLALPVAVLPPAHLRRSGPVKEGNEGDTVERLLKITHTKRTV
jgi:hypothetical protein